MPRDAVSRTAIVERNGGHKWVKDKARERRETDLFPSCVVRYMFPRIYKTENKFKIESEIDVKICDDAFL